MSFGRELKDFAAGFQTVKSAQHQQVQDDYYRALTDKAKKGPRSQSDPDGVMDGAVDESNENIDASQPHGMLYNFGKWLGIGGDDKQAPVAGGPMQTAARSQALPLEGYEAAQQTYNDDEVDGYAKGGMVRGKLSAKKDPSVYDDGGPEVMDDGGPEASTGAIPTEAVTVSAKRNPTGYLQASHNPSTYDDGGPEAGPKVVAPNPTEAVTVTANREPPHPTARPTPDNDGGPEVRDPYAEKVQVAELGPANSGPAEEDGGAPQDTSQAIPAPRDVQAKTDEQIAGANDLGDLSAALHGGIMALQAHFKLNPEAGAIPDQSGVASGQQKLFAGEGRASAEDMQAVAKAVDPKGELSHSQMLMRAMTKGYEHYMAKGDPQRAANFAAMIIQYSTWEAAKHGNDAIEALKAGNVDAAAQSLKAGYDNIPDGREATNVKVNPDKTISVTETDVKTGKAIEQHTLSPQEMYGAAVGLKNKTISWQALMTAAGSAKGYNPAESDAYSAAQAKLAGANPDGTLTDEGNPPAPGAQPPSQAIPTSGQPTQPGQPPSGNLIGRADPNAMHMVESRNNPGAVSPTGAVGVAQTMPSTLRDPGFGVAPAKDNSPEEQQRVGDEYLAALNKRYGDPVMAHIAYNWGPGNAEKWAAAGGDFAKLPTETQQYLGRIAVAQRAGGEQQGSLQPASMKTSAPAQQAQPQAPAQAQPQAPAQGKQPDYNKNPLALRPALPDDAPEQPQLPSEPQMAQLPQRPVPPKQSSLSDFDTSNMAPKERIALQKEIVAKNTAARAKFNEEMRLWTSQATEARTNFNAEHTKYADAMRANKKGVQKDPNALQVKDRNEALTVLQQSRPDPKDQNDPTSKLFGSLQPPSQKAVDNVAYGLYTHNDTTPQRAYQAAVSMMMPQSVNFTPHMMPNGNVRVVFRTGDMMVLPKNTFSELAAARGNEHYIMRSGKEKAAANEAKDKSLYQKGVKAASGLGKAVGNLDPHMPNVGGAVADVVTRGLDKIGDALYDPNAKPDRAAVTVPTI